VGGEVGDQRMSKPRCDQCRYWMETTHVDGECRRYAPHPLATPVHWVRTRSDDWCGDFLRKPELMPPYDPEYRA